MQWCLRSAGSPSLPPGSLPVSLPVSLSLSGLRSYLYPFRRYLNPAEHSGCTASAMRLAGFVGMRQIAGPSYFDGDDGELVLFKNGWSNKKLEPISSESLYSILTLHAQ